jgi:hypothetical protein
MPPACPEIRPGGAAVDLALVMHERGHNLGYRHIADTVMQEGTPVVPGWAYEWAAALIPSRRPSARVVSNAAGRGPAGG